MKKFILRRQFRIFLPLLGIAILLTLPSALTQSKYVWNEEIDIKLSVSYPNTVITSLRPAGYPSEFWSWEFTNIQAAATEEGLVLTAEEGYVLPETFSVQIGQTVYTVCTGGLENPEGIAFDPSTNLLSISENLIEQNPGGVTVSAVALSKELSNVEDVGENIQGTAGSTDTNTAGQTAGDVAGNTDEGTAGTAVEKMDGNTEDSTAGTAIEKMDGNSEDSIAGTDAGNADVDAGEI